MAPEETFCVWGMNVVFGVRMLMVSTVVSGPPQGSPLTGTTGDECPDELDSPACLETAVGKIPMIKGGDRKHPYAVRKEGDENAGQGDREEKGCYAGQVNKDVGQTAKPLELPFVGIGFSKGFWWGAYPLEN